MMWPVVLNTPWMQWHRHIRAPTNGGSVLGKLKNWISGLVDIVALCLALFAERRSTPAQSTAWWSWPP